METIEKGALYLVSTPIGNLADITYRAVHVLNNVDLIAAEDTRNSSVLMKNYQIDTPLSSYHSYNLKKETRRLIEKLKHESTIALISDAGTPGISDPGFHLVQEAVKEKIRVIPIPGASAFLAALTASGLPNNRFVYEGFLPLKKGRKTRLKTLSEEERTIVFYESPHRIHRTVRELLETFGDRPCTMAREITKLYEEFLRGTLSALQKWIEERRVKGEIVLIVQGKAHTKGKQHGNEQ